MTEMAVSGSAVTRDVRARTARSPSRRTTSSPLELAGIQWRFLDDDGPLTPEALADSTASTTTPRR